MYSLIPSPAEQDEAQPPMAASGRVSALTLIRRIEDVIDRETDAIRSDPDFDLKASNARKSRYIYELGKALKGHGRLGDEHREALSGLREKLAVNEAVIRAHMSAVNEIADLLQKAIEHSQTDGTYSVREFGMAEAR